MARSVGKSARASKVQEVASRPDGRTSLVGRAARALTGFVWGPPLDERAAGHLREIKGLCLIGFALFTLVAMVSFYAPYHDPGAHGSNWAGQVGWYIANGVYC